MSWTIYFEGFSKKELSNKDRNFLQNHLRFWNKKLHLGSSKYNLYLTNNGKKISGNVSIEYSWRQTRDFINILTAFQELEEKLTNFKVYASDTYYLSDDLPSSIGEPKKFIITEEGELNNAFFDVGEFLFNRIISFLRFLKFMFFDIFFIDQN